MKAPKAAGKAFALPVAFFYPMSYKRDNKRETAKDERERCTIRAKRQEDKKEKPEFITKSDFSNVNWVYLKTSDFATVILFSVFSFQYSFRKSCREKLKNED